MKKGRDCAPALSKLYLCSHVCIEEFVGSPVSAVACALGLVCDLSATRRHQLSAVKLQQQKKIGGGENAHYHSNSHHSTYVPPAVDCTSSGKLPKRHHRREGRHGAVDVACRAAARAVAPSRQGPLSTLCIITPGAPLIATPVGGAGRGLFGTAAGVAEGGHYHGGGARLATARAATRKGQATYQRRR